MSNNINTKVKSSRAKQNSNKNNNNNNNKQQVTRFQQNNYRQKPVQKQQQVQRQLPTSGYKVIEGQSRDYQKQFKDKRSLLDAYAKCVLSPFNSEIVRGPSMFYQPTSLLDFKLEYDFAPGTSNASIIVHPQCFMQQGYTNSFCWANFYNQGPGAVTYGTGNINYPSAVFTHPLAGGVNVSSSPTQYWTQDPTSSSGARWLSARLVSTGIKIIPTGQNINRSGTITLGIVPGSTQLYTSTTYSIPSAQMLRQYPTSYEVSVTGIDDRGTDLVWLPLDPIDQKFIQGGPLSLNQDSDSQMSYYRNPMYVLLNGIQTTDTFRVEVVTRVEFVPTLLFNSWSPSVSSKLSEVDTIPFQQAITSSIGQAVSGQLGQILTSGKLDTGRLFNTVLNGGMSMLSIMA